MSGFKTKARTVELLGRKQIRDSVTALAELMKNAYDADAPWLRVEFSTTGSNQHVVIVDTGLGMSQNDIESKWLVLGTNSKTKRANKTSPSGRPLMGAKGIGRLASATLGKQLWMFTKTEESLWNIVFINWDIFENPYISIEDVRVPTRFGVSSQELILRFDSIIAEMLSEQRSNLENPGWYPENDIDGIVAPLLNGIRNSLSKASIEKKDVEKYIASFKCGTILHIDQLHDDWNRYISPKEHVQRDISQQVSIERECFFSEVFPVLVQILVSSPDILFAGAELVQNLKYHYYDDTDLNTILAAGKELKKAEKETYLRNKFHYGDILIRNRKGSATEYLLCISPPCDVCRPGKVKLNICFINGLEVPEAELTVKRKENVHISVLPINNGCKTDLKYVAWRLFDIVKFDLGKKEDYESICSYSRPFMMSEQYSRQIGNLFTSYFSRAGVDELFMKSAQNLRALFK